MTQLVPHLHLHHLHGLELEPCGMTKPKPPRQPPRRRFLQAESGFDIVQAMDTLFMRWFEGESWDPWRVILKAAFCLGRLTTSQRNFFRSVMGHCRPAFRQ